MIIRRIYGIFENLRLQFCCMTIIYRADVL